MAALQSMTLQERMVTIINAEHSLSYGINDLTFQEACNKWLIETGTVNGVDYSGISINKYSPNEALAIIRHKLDLRSENLTELIHELGPYYPLYTYTAQEALNKKNAVLAPYALSFDAMNDYVSVSSISLAGDFTISIWLRFSDITSRMILGNTGSASDLFWINSSSHVQILSSDLNIEFSNSVFSSLLNTWVHLVVTRDGSNIPKCYMDGVLTDTLSADAGTFTFDQIGRYYTSSSSQMYGKVDELSVFTKALTQAEVSSLYAANPQNAGDAVGITNLVGYWKMDEGTGEPQDSSGNGNHGTITGATWVVH